MVPLYMDHHVPRAITEGLRLRGTDVITAYDDGTSDMDDSALQYYSCRSDGFLLHRFHLSSPSAFGLQSSAFDLFYWDKIIHQNKGRP
jgi:hypothetical protein